MIDLVGGMFKFQEYIRLGSIENDAFKLHNYTL